MTKEALYYKEKSNNKVTCTLCPHECSLSENKRGKCKVRINIQGKLLSENYNLISAIHSDPIEKKPLYHFYPGKNILSVGSIGCNMKCNFCQNCSISQTNTAKFQGGKTINSDSLISEAIQTQNNIGIAYTYNEPTVWYEYMFETAVKAKNKGLVNVMVTNGYINKKPLKKLLPYIDAFNIDLKAYSNSFYKKETKSSLKPVLKTIYTVAESETHFEITNLIIPGLNDNKKRFKEMIHMLSDINKNIVLHLSRYFPAYKSKIEASKKKTMLALYDIAQKYLNYVYLGNMLSEKGQNTYCPKCKTEIISRTPYSTQMNGIKNNACIHCNHHIPIKY